MSLVNSIIVIDFETGGLVCTKNPAIEVAVQCFDLDTLKPTMEYESFIQPYGNLEIEQQALNANGITTQQIASGAPVKQVVADLVEIFKAANSSGNARKKPIIVGHNIGFDVGFLCYIFDFCKVDISKYLDCNPDAWGHQIPKSVDTQTLAKMLWGDQASMTKYNLGACCQKGSIDLIDAHRAMNDVKGTKELFYQFVNRLRAMGGEITKTEHQRVRNHFKYK